MLNLVLALLLDTAKLMRPGLSRFKPRMPALACAPTTRCWWLEQHPIYPPAVNAGSLSTGLGFKSVRSKSFPHRLCAKLPRITMFRLSNLKVQQENLSSTNRDYADCSPSGAPGKIMAHLLMIFNLLTVCHKISFSTIWSFCSLFSLATMNNKTDTFPAK